tara:strand:- start:8481 stop:9014 length:534 start_codon:yes stop_codon:yes gene_type:complete
MRDVLMNTRLSFPKFNIYQNFKDDYEGDFFRFAAECRGSMVYLSSPYASKPIFQTSAGVTQSVSDLRATQTAVFTHWLLNAGIWAFSPIVYGSGLKKFTEERTKEWWMRRNAEFFKRADALAVFALDGWQDSPGVAEEIGWACTTKKPVYILELKGSWFDGEATTGSEFREKILGGE